MYRWTLTTWILLIGFAVTAQSARSELVIAYTVNIVESGPVTVGSTINWEIFATVSGVPNVGINNGIAAAAIDLQDSFGDTLNPGNVQDSNGEDFDGYGFSNNGTFVAGKLQNIGTLQFDADPMTVGRPGDLGPHLLATGSYTVTTIGLHTLSTVQSASISRYWSTPGPGATPTNFDSSLFGDNVEMGSDSILVTEAVPEPSSLAMMALAASGAWGLRRRKNPKSTPS